jgi:hypothetical protein
LAIVVPNAVLWAVPLLTKLYMGITGGHKKNRQLIPDED